MPQKKKELWEAPLEVFQNNSDFELSMKYDCSAALVSRIRIKRFNFRHKDRTCHFEDNQIETYTLRNYDPAFKEQELREREYERCKAAGCVWEPGMALDRLNPSLRAFLEKHL